ncbi:MAG TPA: PQQ-binding-like beta-propeller repeat protein [Thermomicrobiales bacterium]|nr:PQQ-binding-like beta-propeller repeat protein [Thermomicrobiales bacterium]
MPASNTPDPSTTPLGGSLRRQEHRRDRFARNWTGYVPLIRACPRCGTENNQQFRFCAGCAASIDEVTPTPSSDPNSGIRAMEERLRKEAEEARRSRLYLPDAGTGFIITGIVLLLITALFPLPLPIRIGVWLLGLLSTGSGLYRMRFDGDAIRRTGFILGASAIGLVTLVVTRGTPPTDPASLLATEEPTATTVAAASPVSTPATRAVTGSVLSYLGDASHSGLQDGPPPDGNPALAWRFDTGSEILSSPVVADGTVYITNREGFLYAVDASTGQQLWRVNMGKYVLRTTPTYLDGTLYVVAGFDTVALDAETGAERWRTTIRYAGTASPTVAGDEVYVVSQEGWLYAFSTRDGSERWKAATDGISFGSPSVIGNLIVVGTDSGKVVGMNRETGRQTWTREFESSVYTTPVVADEIVWIVTADGQLHGLDLEDGSDRFTLETTADLTVTAMDDRVFVPSDDGGVYAFDPESGDVHWFASAGGPVKAGPVRTDAQIVVAGGNRIAGFDAETGEQAWYYLAGDAVEAPPAVVSGYVFFGARDGVLYAVTSNG